MVITELDIGGAERAFARVAVGLQSLGWHVDVVSLRDFGPMAMELQRQGVTVVSLNCGGPWDLRAIWRLRSHLKRVRPAAVLSFLHQANLASRFAARLAGVPTHVSGIRVADRRRWVTWPDWLSSGFVSKYVAVSHAVAKVHAACCGLSDLPVVIPNGVDVNAIASAPMADRRTMGCQSDDVIILSVGRLSPQKAPLEALEGFRLLLTRVSPEMAKRLKLVFAGDGPLKEHLQRQVHEQNLNAHVHLIGWRADIWSLMKASQVLLLASHWEGLPNVIMEAQAASLPVVASDIDGNAELIQHRVTGRLFTAGNTDELAQQLLETIQEVSQTHQITLAAFQSIQKWTWDAATQAYDQLLWELLSVIEEC